MKASSVTRGVVTSLAVKNWAWWQTPWCLRAYVGLVPLVALGLTCYAASQTTWYSSDLVRFFLLLGCGMVSVAATPPTAYIPGGMTRDFLTVWVLPVAILLPPVYAMLTVVPLQILTLIRVFRGSSTVGCSPWARSPSPTARRRWCSGPSRRPSPAPRSAAAGTP